MAFQRTTLAQTDQGQMIVGTWGTSMFRRQPHTAVMPYAARDFVNSPGFKIHYNTSDPAILQQLHDAVVECVQEVGISQYRGMLGLNCFHPNPAKGSLYGRFVESVYGVEEESATFGRMRDAVNYVKMGTCLYLVEQYLPRQEGDRETAVALAASVVNELFCDEPAPYAKKHPAVVSACVAALQHEDRELRLLLTDALRAHDKVRYVERAGRLEGSCVRRAHELGILILGGDAPDQTFIPKAEAFYRRMAGA